MISMTLAGLFTRAKEGTGNEEWHEAPAYQSSLQRLETPIVAPKPDSNRRPEDRSSFSRSTSHRPTTPVSCLRDSRSRSRRSRATNWLSRNDGHDRALDGVKRRSLRIVPDRDTVKVRPLASHPTVVIVIRVPVFPISPSGPSRDARRAGTWARSIETLRQLRLETPERVLQRPGSRTILVADRGDAWRDKAR
ncbi:hypothetical protein G5I_05440 [Acromyrmex echinatior]|uniref:Uncharacterized protein n=1 Tax=Acromyrmex echinatior TaxID=103372 RepID=F4WIB8_ACREC|nr:hypothetical protein G5I_05440 [Acromyrmex echinatior]